MKMAGLDAVHRNLGGQSFITITSMKEGAQQRLDATSMQEWQQQSAFFNGKAVEVELQVSPDDMGAFLKSVSLFYRGERERDNVHGRETREWAQDCMQSAC